MEKDAIEHAAAHYDEYMHDDKDIVPSRVYKYQINFRKNQLRQELMNRKFNTILDLGSGIGLNAIVLDEFAAKLLILSDLSQEALKIAASRKYKNKIKTVLCDAAEFSLESTDKIDLIHICGVLHHLPKKLKPCINNLSRYTKKGSWIIVDEPNSLNALTTILMKVSDADPVGDERPLRLSKILRLFLDAGFRPRKILHYSFFVPFGLLFSSNKHLIRILEKIDSSLGKSVLRHFSMRWRIVLERV